MNETSTEALGDALLTLLQDRHGEEAAHALLIFLCAVSGRTNYPLHARTVGGGMGHDAIANTVEQLVGPESCKHLTSLTVAGLMSLEAKGQQGVRSILYSGDLVDPHLVRALSRMVAGQHLRSLDGSPTGHDRYRKVDRRLALVLLRADDLADPAILPGLLTIKIVRSPASTDRALTKALAPFRGEHRPTKELGLLEQLNRWVQQSALQATVTFADDVMAKIKAQDLSDVHRIQQVLSLAAVWRLVNTYPGSSIERVAGTVSDLEFVLSLLRQVGVEDERVRIAPRHAATLKLLQAKESTLKTADNPSGLFTLYNIRGCLPEPKPCIDTIRNNLIALEKAGYLEEHGKIESKKAWILTIAGRNYHPTSLTDHLRQLLQLSNTPNGPKNSELNQADRRLTKHATPGTNGDHSDRFQHGSSRS